VLAAWEVMAIAVVAILLIGEFVRRTYGPRAALVMLALAVASLTVVWIAYEVWPIEQWRRGNLAVGLAIFALPALAGVIIAWRRGALSRSAIGFLVALWATPALLLHLSQLRLFDSAADPSFAHSLWWAAVTLTIYIAVPVAYALFTGQAIRSYGLSLGFIRSEAAFIALLAPAIVVLVWLVSSDERFLRTYPFYDYESGGDNALVKLLVFEVAYGATFVALEFFFRGFLVFAGLPILGVHAVPVMAFGYCLLHLGKPMPECASSLIGGLILGYVALRLRSIAAGVVAHLTMAWGMDAFVVGRQ
jgi:hypothetical protein